MPEMKNSFQRGRMNKDLDERVVPQGEYRDALNVEVNTSESSNVGTLQTIKGNSYLEGQPWDDGHCIGSIANDRNDKLYFMVAGVERDLIIEYDHFTSIFSPVCVDAHFGGVRALSFNKQNLITGINVIDDTIYWTDNHSEPKRINITRGKEGSKTGGISDYFTTTRVMVKDTMSPGMAYVNAVDDEGQDVDILERHLTVIKQAPPGPPVLEMIDTQRADADGDTSIGGGEIRRSMTLTSTPAQWLDATGDFITPLQITVETDTDGDGTGTDFTSGDYVLVSAVEDPSIKVRLFITAQVPPGNSVSYTCEYISGDKDITAFDDYVVVLEQPDALFEFKLARFGYRYKYIDGEYSTFSSFTQPAFLPGTFNYMPKEGYNLGMVNRLRKLAIKNFVHTRQMPEDVVSVDILYKESNSTNIYSVTTVKKRVPNKDKWDEWNAISPTAVNWLGPTPVGVNGGYNGKTKGYLPITSEMIHAVLPANQLLRPWDNVPRMALAQEVVGNRLVYGNYLQNYNLSNNEPGINDNNIKVDLKAVITSAKLGDISPAEVQAPAPGFIGNNKGYSPTKSLKTLRTYQLGIVYIDKYGRETPVFSEDKRGLAGSEELITQASIYNKKINSASRNSLTGTLKSNPPDWATHFKYFVKETSNEYYNLAMDRWYNAEDGNIWLSFPSAERNKVDEETFLILKKEHDGDTPITEKARYKILAISNEAPRFIKLQNISIGSIIDDGTLIGAGSSGFPLPGEVFITVESAAFMFAGWDIKLIEESISQTYLRVRNSTAVSRWYEIKSVEKLSTGDYRIKSKQTFKADMSHTSVDGTVGTFLPTNILDIVRRVEQDKAEFDGRFFAKILKDGTVIQRLGVKEDASLLYVNDASMAVQYIDPDAVPAATTEQYFGFPKSGINAHKYNWGEWTSPMYHRAQYGEKYWKNAGDSRAAVTSAVSGNTSSGWFIDKVEGFRPFKGNNGYEQNKNNNLRWDVDTPPALTWFPLEYIFAHPVRNTLNALGTGTWNNGNMTTNYLGGTNPLRSPHNFTTQEPVLKDKLVLDGGQIVPSQGIDRFASTITISYAGTQCKDGNREGSSGNPAVGEYHSDNSFHHLDNHYFDNAAENVLNIEFITKLTTPGTLWAWGEDPGEIIYKTISNDGLTNSTTPFTQAQWNAESQDMIDLKPGVLLFNYAVFADYVIDFHHKHSFSWWFFGTVTKQESKRDWQSRVIYDDLTSYNNPAVGIAAWLSWGAIYSPVWHGAPGNYGSKQWYSGNNSAPAANLAEVDYDEHHSFPTGIYEWDAFANKRRRFTIKVETAGALGQPAGLKVGSVGPHYYLPTNDCTNEPHWGYTAGVFGAIETNPATGQDFVNYPGQTGFAPGIRPDGMYSGHDIAQFTWHNGAFVEVESTIPNRRRFDSLENLQSANATPGSVTWNIKQPFVEEADGSAVYSSTNPAIWETEPKEDVGLDIYNEVGQTYPIYLNDDTIEQFVGAVGSDISKNSYVQCWDGPPPMGGATGTITLNTNTGGTLQQEKQAKDIRVSAAYDRFVQLSDVNGVVLDSSGGTHTMPVTGSYLIFHRADGGTTEAHVGAVSYNETGVGEWFELIGATDAFGVQEVGVHNKMVTLPWFNCYSFGNGVESDRIRDDFNQVTIDNGPKVSTTIEGQYVEDRRENGFIWSGIYNSTSGVNNLNQFIQAEAITKDINPSYGSIQKLSVRDSDLVAFCEDRILNVQANKDALFNADGNTNIVATNKVLGHVKPFVGDYGISKNPESFAKDSYRSYFTDTSRGAVIRLSQDGLTPISDAGMKDWFADNLPKYTPLDSRIIGSFDDKKQEYNVTLNSSWRTGSKSFSNTATLEAITISYSEAAKGWVSFKSFIQENGISLNNSYYTLKEGKLYEHHINEVRNNFYLDPTATVSFSNPQYDSSVDILFNQNQSIIKSFSTLNYEGSQSRITADTITNPDYYDNIPKEGWYISNMTSKQIIDSLQDGQELGEMEFWDKEDKWFSQIKGVATKWLNDGTAGNIDPREFSYQGIGNAGEVSCPTCPPTNPAWNCLPSSPAVPGVPGTPLIPGYYTQATNTCPNQIFNSGTGVSFMDTNEPHQFVVDTSAGGGSHIDVSTVMFDIDSTYWDTHPIQGLNTSDFCEGSVPGTYSMYFSTDNGGPGSGRIKVLADFSLPGAVASVNCSDPASFGNVIPAGMNASGYNTYDDLLAHTMLLYPGAGITMTTPYQTWSVLMGVYHGNSVTGGNQVCQFSICFPQVKPCLCTSTWVPPVPAVPAIPAIPAVIGGCTMVVGGQYSTLSLCQTACNPIPASWNCITATSTTYPYLPIYYCLDPMDGSGTYSNFNLCIASCATPPIPQTFECINGACIELFNGMGNFTTLVDCNNNCGVPTAVSWNCINGVCVDPGTGLGTYTDLTTCQSLCNPIIVGNCNIQGAPAWDATTAFMPGDVVSYLGIWYHQITTISVTGTAPIGMTFSTQYWEICLLTNVGSCDISSAEDWDITVQNGTTANSDGTFGYDEDDVVSTTWWNGNVTYYYSLYDVAASSTFAPGGLTFDPNPLPFGQINPWQDCDGQGLTTFGTYDLGIGTPCDVSNYEVWDPTFDYQVGVYDNSPTPLNPHWAVLHNGVFWILGCMQVNPSLADYLNNSGTFGYSWQQPNPWGYGDATSGTTVVGADGTVGDPNLPNGLGDQIIQEQNDCLFGIGGLPTSQAGIEPGSPYSPWIPCINQPLQISSSGCCNQAWTFLQNWQTYGSQAMACYSDPMCTCNGAQCI